MHEYGLVIVAVIACTMFFGLVVKLNSGKEGSMQFAYKTHMLYTDFYDKTSGGTVGVSELLDSINGVNNTLENYGKPYFQLDNTKTLETTFKLSEIGNGYFHKIDDTENEGHYYIAIAGDGVKATDAEYNKFKHRLAGDESGIEALTLYDRDKGLLSIDNVHIVIVEYQPKVEYRYDGLDYTKYYVTADEDSLDEFGNRIYNESAKEFEQSSQLQYTQVIWQEVNENDSLNDTSDSDRVYKDIREFKIDPDLPSRYKVLYRYTDGGLKCEYTSLFINEVRSESDILFN